MRLFVAVELPRKVREMAQETAVSLGERLDRGIGLRWVSSDQMHLTVRFIGHVPDDRVTGVMDALEPPLPIGPFEVEFRDCGVFPKSGPPRVIWIGLAKGLSELAAMHEEFNRRLDAFGFVAETRPFSGHLTLARIKEIDREAARQLRIAIRDVHPRGVQCRVDSVTVFKSDLSAHGSRYSAMLHVPLTTDR